MSGYVRMAATRAALALAAFAAATPNVTAVDEHQTMDMSKLPRLTKAEKKLAKRMRHRA